MMELSNTKFALLLTFFCVLSGGVCAQEITSESYCSLRNYYDGFNHDRYLRLTFRSTGKQRGVFHFTFIKESNNTIWFKYNGLIKENFLRIHGGEAVAQLKRFEFVKKELYINVTLDDSQPRVLELKTNISEDCFKNIKKYFNFSEKWGNTFKVYKK